MPEFSKIAKRVYCALIFASLMGTVMPILSQASKLKNKINLSERLTEHLGTAFFNDLILWMVNVLPKWHDMNVGGDHGIYIIRWSIWSFLITVALILFHKRVLELLTRLAAFYSKQKIIFAAVIFILITFPSTFFWGFWFKGLGGWDYRTIKSELIPLEGNKFLRDSKRNYLLAGINVENFKTYVGPGCLENQVVIGFHNGGKFPINDGISGFVRAAYFHKFMQPPDVDHEEVPWLQIINHRMKKLSKENRFWKKIKYPNHTTYMPLPFETAGIDGFEKIEYWNVVACFDSEEVFISKAELLKTYD